MSHTVPEEYLTHIGDMVVSFALLEMNIQILITSLINEHQRLGQIITAELAFKNLRALAISLYIDRHDRDEDFPNLKKLMTDAGRIESERNKITHSVWALGKGFIQQFKTTAKEKKGLAFKFEKYTVTDLQQLVEDIQSCSHEIQKLTTKLVTNGKAINNPIHKTW